MPKGIKKQTYTGYQGKKQTGGGTKKSYAKSKYAPTRPPKAAPPRRAPRRTSAGAPVPTTQSRGRQGTGSRPYSYANPNLLQRLRNFWWRLNRRPAVTQTTLPSTYVPGMGWYNPAGLSQQEVLDVARAGTGGGYRASLEQRRQAAVARRQAGGGRVSAQSRPYGYVQEQYSPYYGYEEVMGYPEEGYSEYPVEFPYEEYPGYGMGSYPFYGGGGGGYQEKNRVAYPYAGAEGAPMGGVAGQMPRYAYQPQIEMPRWYQNLVNWQF